MPENCPYNCNKGRIFDSATHTFIPCPHCLGIVSELTSSKREENTQEIDLLDKLCIPDMYRDAKFNPETFFGAQSRRTFAASTFRPVLEKLVSIEDSVKRSRVLRESCYFYCGIPDAESTYAYVYYILRLAVKFGLSAVPFASLMDLHEVRFRTPETSRLYSNLTWYDYTTADVCFLCSTAKAGDNEFVLLADLLQERARRGLPTYIIGYWTRETLKKQRATITYLFSDDEIRLSTLSYFGVQTERALRDSNGDTNAGYSQRNTRYTTASAGIVNALAMAGNVQNNTFGASGAQNSGLGIANPSSGGLGVANPPSGGLGVANNAQIGAAPPSMGIIAQPSDTNHASTSITAPPHVAEQPSSNLMGVSPRKYGYNNNFGGSNS